MPTCSFSNIGYWRILWSSDFANQILEDCVDVVHTDIVEVWSLDDRDKVCLSLHLVIVVLLSKTKYLLGREFRDKMSALVQDLAEPPADPSAG